MQEICSGKRTENSLKPKILEFMTASGILWRLQRLFSFTGDTRAMITVQLENRVNFLLARAPPRSRRRCSAVNLQLTPAVQLLTDRAPRKISNDTASVCRIVHTLRQSKFLLIYLWKVHDSLAIFHVLRGGLVKCATDISMNLGACSS
jgi:hypothetical protein